MVAGARKAGLVAVLCGTEALNGPLGRLAPSRPRRAARTGLREPLITASERTARFDRIQEKTREESLEWSAPDSEGLARILGRDLQGWSR
jgi:hypothetical protein